MERRLAAILAADVVGYTRMMGDDEAGTLCRLTILREQVVEPLIAEHGGRVVKLLGDGLLVEFSSVVDAVACAVAWQEAVAEHEDSYESCLQFRIGINLGDVIVQADDIHGDGVNIAARLEGLAEPGGICLSVDAYRQAKGKVEAEFEDCGEQALKNVAEPVQVYRIGGSRSGTDVARPSREQLPLPDKPSIAVLPFTNMSGEAEQEHFSDGISEDIITALSKLAKLFVVARNSSFTYKGRAVDVKQVGRELGVQYVLEGSVRRGGNRLRITAQLIDAVSGHHIWAQRYDRVMQDMFELQDEITREVTSALQVQLTEGEQARLWAGGTQNHEAWEIIIQASQLIQSHRRQDNFECRRLAKRALNLDEHYADAWTWLGWTYFHDVFHNWSDTPEASLKLATDAAKRAQSIDRSNPDLYSLFTFISLSERDYERAEEMSKEAMALGPNNSFAAAVAANVALFCNRPEEMIALLGKAMRLCPIYPAWYVGDVAWAHLLLGRYDDCLSAARESNRIDPDYIFTYMVQAVALAELDRTEEAKAATAHILRIEPGYSQRTFAETQPFRDAEVLDRHIRGLRKAGLPE